VQSDLACSSGKYQPEALGPTSLLCRWGGSPHNQRGLAESIIAVGKWPAGATAQSLAEVGDLSTARVIADLG
jgi:hypothetical protein